MNVYPALDLLDGLVVRLQRGRYDAVTVYSDDPVGIVRGFVVAGAARVHIVDLDGARDGRPAQAELVRRVVRETGATVQVGGGIRTMSQVEAYVDAGVERVVLGTAAVKDPGFLEAACGRYAIVVAVDARYGLVATDGWTEGSTIRAMDLASRAQRMGARAVLFTDIARDGTGEGPNVNATAALAREVMGLEVIASGGIGAVSHIRALAARTEITACVVGRALYDGTLSVSEAIAAGRVPG